MKAILVLALSLLVSTFALAGDKKISCSLTVSPRGGDSKTTKSGRGGSLLRSNTNLSNTGTKTIERNLKWLVEVRFREERPDKTEVKVYYLGYGDGGKMLKQIGQETKTLTLDKNGRASVELTSPTTKLRKTRTQQSSSSRGSSSGFRSVKSTTSGDRVSGCVVQLFGDGELLKSYVSDSRWASVADDVPFSIAELTKRSGRIGLR